MEQDVLDLVDLVLEIKSKEEENITQILDFKKEFCKKLSEEKEKIPYNINLLDEIHANENAHSRIFIKLLQYKEINNYKLLNSFLSYIGDPFSKLKFNNPTITAEKDRIDIRIRGQNETLIIENKIHGAGDQEQQITRYIKKEKDAGYEITSNIYVLYLTKEGGSPSEDSLSKKNKKTLGQRYKEINYRNDILPWLKTLVDTDEQWLEINKLEILKSAIVQYTDHLEGMFFQREGEEIMKNNILEVISKKIDLDTLEKASEKMKKINDYMEYINEVTNYFEELKKEVALESLEYFVSSLKKESIEGIKNIQYPSNNKKFGNTEQGIFFKPKNWNNNFAIGLEFGDELKDLYCGIRHFKNDASDNLQNQLSKIFGKEKSNEFNKYWPYSKYINIDADFDDIINSVDDGSLLDMTKRMITEILNNTKKVTELMK